MQCVVYRPSGALQSSKCVWRAGGGADCLSAVDGPPLRLSLRRTRVVSPRTHIPHTVDCSQGHQPGHSVTPAPFPHTKWVRWSGSGGRDGRLSQLPADSDVPATSKSAQVERGDREQHSPTSRHRTAEPPLPVSCCVVCSVPSTLCLCSPTRPALSTWATCACTV